MARTKPSTNLTLSKAHRFRLGRLTKQFSRSSKTNMVESLIDREYQRFVWDRRGNAVERGRM